MHITQFYCFFKNIMFLVEFICHQKCTSWRKLHFSACCTNDIFVDIFQNMVNIYYFGWFFVSFKSPLLFLVLLCCITRKSSAKNEFCCVSNKNYCKTRKRPRSSAIIGQRTQFSHLFCFCCAETEETLIDAVQKQCGLVGFFPQILLFDVLLITISKT